MWHRSTVDIICVFTCCAQCVMTISCSFPCAGCHLSCAPYVAVLWQYGDTCIPLCRTLSVRLASLHSTAQTVKALFTLCSSGHGIQIIINFSNNQVSRSAIICVIQLIKQEGLNGHIYFYRGFHLCASWQQYWCCTSTYVQNVQN